MFAANTSICVLSQRTKRNSTAVRKASRAVPGRPNDFWVPQTVVDLVNRQIPIFGVCLGLQGIVEAFGGELGVLNYPQHGKSSRIFVTDSDSVLFRGLPESFAVGRYHSLFAIAKSLPQELKVTAISDDNVIMGIEHQTLPIAAVQFHPRINRESGLYTPADLSFVAEAGVRTVLVGESLVKQSCH